MTKTEDRKRMRGLPPGWDIRAHGTGVLISSDHPDEGVLYLKNGAGSRERVMLHALATDFLELGPAEKAPSLPDVETLADMIREIDGGGSLSLGATKLAEGLIARLGTSKAG